MKVAAKAKATRKLKTTKTREDGGSRTRLQVAKQTAKDQFKERAKRQIEKDEKLRQQRERDAAERRKQLNAVARKNVIANENSKNASISTENSKMSKKKIKPRQMKRSNWADGLYTQAHGKAPVISKIIEPLDEDIIDDTPLVKKLAALSMNKKHKEVTALSMNKQKEVAVKHIEKRIDVSDGNAYTQAEFKEFYGGVEEWDRSSVKPCIVETSVSSSENSSNKISKSKNIKKNNKNHNSKNDSDEIPVATLPPSIPSTTSNSNSKPKPKFLASPFLSDIVGSIDEQREQWPWLFDDDESEKDDKAISVAAQKAKDAKTRLNQKLLSKYKAKRKTKKFKTMLGQRENLPAYNMREQIAKLIRNNQVTVVSGETGCGKTTQLPQIVLDDMMESGHGADCNIICTQPRRISAIGVADRVADERAEKIGQTVGYQIRLESRRSKETRLLFCTTGVLLRRLQCDSSVSGVSHIFVDEVHERDLNSDFLLIMYVFTMNFIFFY